MSSEKLRQKWENPGFFLIGTSNHPISGDLIPTFPPDQFIPAESVLFGRIRYVLIHFFTFLEGFRQSRPIIPIGTQSCWQQARFFCCKRVAATATPTGWSDELQRKRRLSRAFASRNVARVRLLNGRNRSKSARLQRMCSCLVARNAGMVPAAT